MGSLYEWSDRFPEAGPMPETYDGPWFTGLRPGAGDPELHRAEKRLGRVLPPTYRDFLGFADGWDFGEENILGSAEAGWLRDLEPHWITAFGPRPGDAVPSVSDDDYFVYGPGQQSHHMRGEYLPHTLLIGHRDDGVYLLNPEVITPEGEWEALYLAPWLPGAVRARSFWELVQKW